MRIPHFVFFSLILLTSCNGTIKTSNTAGDWYYEITRNIGGYKVSMNSKLTIIRVEAGIYKYILAQSTTDQMYGGNPKHEITSGKFEEYIFNNKWVFSEGEFGNREAYVLVPDDKWSDYKPNTITVKFPPNRGNTMTFQRY